jgi:putative transposase
MAHAHKADRSELRPYFITITIVNWLPVFSDPAYCEIIVSSFTFMREHRGLAVHAYVIMPTHVHAIVSALHGDLPGIIRDFKRFTSRSIFSLAESQSRRDLLHAFEAAADGALHARFHVWQEGFCPEILFSRKFLDQKATYVHANPVRKGLAEDPAQWKYSSFKAWAIGDMEPFPVDPLEW